MKSNQLKSGVVLSYLSMAINIFLTLTYTPLMLKLLGQNEYGLYNTVSSAISMLSLLSLGFNSGYIRYFAKYKAENQQEKIDKLNGLFLTIFTVIGLVALTCGLVLSYNLNWVFDSGLTSSEYKTAKVLAILLTVNLALSFPMSVFSSIINAHERFVLLKAVHMIKTVLSPLLTLPLLFAGYKSIAIALVTVICSLFADCIYIYYVFVKLKCRFLFRGFENKIFVGLFGYTLFIAINMIVDQINWNIDKLLLTRFKGTAEVAIYSVAYTLSTCYQLFSTSISNVFTPRIHKIVNQTEKSQQRTVLTELFTKVGRIQFLVLGLISTALIFFGKPFITKFWAGDGYTNSYYVAMLLILPSSIPLIQNLGIEIQRAENNHRFRSIAYATMALMNLVISIYLCKLYGAVGAAAGTAVSLVLVNGVVMNIYYHKKCNINILHFWKEIFLMIKGLIIPVVTGIVLNKLFDITSFFQFVLAAMIYVVVYLVSVWFLSMNTYEKGFVLNILKKFKRVKND